MNLDTTCSRTSGSVREGELANKPLEWKVATFNTEANVQATCVACRGSRESKFGAS